MWDRRLESRFEWYLNEYDSLNLLEALGQDSLSHQRELPRAEACLGEMSEVESFLLPQGKNHLCIPIFTVFVKGSGSSGDRAKGFSFFGPTETVPILSGSVNNQEHFETIRTGLSIGPEPTGKLSGRQLPAGGTGRSELLQTCLAGGCQCQRGEDPDCFSRRNCRNILQRHSKPSGNQG